MGTYEELKAAIRQVITTNGNNEITGALLRQTLLSIVNTVGSNATFAGIATPTTNPRTPDQNIFYLAFQVGNYINFNDIELFEGEIILLVNNSGTWRKIMLNLANGQSFLKIEQDVTGGQRHVNVSSITYISYPIQKNKTYIIEVITTNNAVSLFGRNGETSEGQELISYFSTTGKREYTATSDFDRIYIYFSSGSSGNVEFNISEKKPIAEVLDYVANEVSRISPLVDSISSLVDKKYSYTFAGNAESNAILIEPIILTKDGDSIEIEVDTLLKGAYASYTFSRNATASNGISIGLVSNYMSVRDSQSSWLLLTDLAESNSQRMKIEYADGKIYIYDRQDSLLKTIDTQSEIRIDSFGNGSNGVYGYWSGTIKSIKVNGEDYQLFKNAQLNNIVISESKEENMPQRLVRKTTDLLQVGFNIPNSNEYIVYPIIHASSDYVDGQYPSFYNVWGLKKPFVGIIVNNEFVLKERIFSDGEAEIAFGVPNPLETYSTIVGGRTHGFDNITTSNGVRDLVLLIDNKKIAEDEELTLRTFDEIILLQQSELFQVYTVENPWAKAIKKWTFNNQGAKFEARLNILRDIQIANGYIGMFCVERHLGGLTALPYLTSRVIKDNQPFVTYQTEDGWVLPELNNVDADCKEIILYGETEYGFGVKVLKSSEFAGNGMFMTYNAPTNTYNKVYPQAVANYSAKSGDLIYKEVEFIIRKTNEFTL